MMIVLHKNLSGLSLVLTITQECGSRNNTLKILIANIIELYILSRLQHNHI